MFIDMKKVVAIFLGFTTPLTFVFAAFNDVTVTTSANFLVGGILVSVTGSSATVESISVDSGSFTVGMQSGSSISITVPGGNQPSASTDSDVTQTCTTSSLTLTATGPASIVVTPTGGTCAAASSTSGGSSSGGGVVPPEFLNNGVGSATIISTTNNPPTQPGSYPKFIFTRNLRLNVQHSDVLKLQQYLNTQGFKVAASGPGSPGKETDRFGRLTLNALIKFQEAHMTEILTPSGLKKGTGYFGPSTRAFVNK
jgi:hypothetical protein